MTDTVLSADAIERDIEQTQNNISDTVEALQQRLNPRALLDAVLGDEQNGSQALVAAAKRNPIAVGLIGAGALWLASGQSQSMPMRSTSDHANDDRGPKPGRSRRSWLRGGGHDHRHASYLEHMAKHQPRDGEDDASYQRRRDLARADYFMIDRDHDEPDSTFRQRLNAAQEQFRSSTATFGAKARQAKHDARDSMAHGWSSTGQGASAAYDKAKLWGGEHLWSRSGRL